MSETKNNIHLSTGEAVILVSSLGTVSRTLDTINPKGREQAKEVLALIDKLEPLTK